MTRGFAALVTLLLVACGALCGDEHRVEVPSPDNRLVAISFVRNCGATVDYIAFVEVRRNRRWFQETQTLFTADGVVDQSVQWIGPNHIAISCDGCPSLSSGLRTVPDGRIKVTLVHRQRNDE
jgi:hypothetical protein